MGPIKGSRFFGLLFKVQSYTKKLERWCCKAIEKEVFWKLVLRNSLENGMVRVTSSSVVPPTTSLWELKRLHTVNPIVFTIINANFLKRMRSRCYPSSQIHQFSYHICIIMDRIVPSQNDYIMKILLRMSVCLSVQMSFLSLVTLGPTL